jgi:branched-chain amino acid transport system ATP-binding protein
MLEVQRLCSGYRSVPILWDVDLTVDDGEWVALIGSAGSGKTTLMRTITGLIEPSAGEVRFLDRDLRAVPVHDRVARGMALVPEGRRLFTGMTVTENLMMGTFALPGDRGVREQLERIYGLFPVLRERRRQVVGTLSGGEQQMCAIGRALMSRPSLLLVDELSLGLAPRLVDQLLDALVAIRVEQGATLLVIEQDVQTALSYADRGYVLREGRIVRQGPARDLLDDPDLQRDYLGV